MSSISKLKLKSEIKKRPLSSINKTIHNSNNNYLYDFSQKNTERKISFVKLYNCNNNEISKDNLSERKFNKDYLSNLSYKKSIKENNYIKSPKSKRNIETPRQIISKKMIDKIFEEDNNSLGLSEFIIIKNESSQKRGVFPRNISTKNILHKNNSNFQNKIRNYNYFNKFNSKNKIIYNHFNTYKRDLIKKKFLNYDKKKKDSIKNKDLQSSKGPSYEKNENNKNLEIFKTRSKTCKSLLYNSSLENRNCSEINAQESIDKNECEKIDINNIETDYIKIKNKFLLKFDNFVEIYKKYSSNLDWVRVDYRNTFLNTMTNIFKNLEEYNKYILYEYKINNILSIDIWSNSIIRFYHFFDEILKWQKMMIEEIRFVKKENIYLNKRLFQIENALNTKDEQIKEINKDIIKYDLNNVKNGKNALEKVDKIKKKYENHESNYILTIYQLESELKQLSSILSQNKVDKQYIEELQNKFNIIKNEYDQNKADYKEYQYQNENQIILLKEYNNDLNKKINNYEVEMKSLKEKENDYLEQIIVLKNKIEYSNKIINQKDISIYQLKSEIEKLAEIKKARKLEPAKTLFVPCQ